MKQFLFTDQDVLVPPHWESRQTGRWTLYSCPELPVSEIANGFLVGWKVGHLGRYVEIEVTGDDFRLRMDDCGFMSVVYSPEEGVACSTSGLIAAPDGFRYDIPAKDYYYPFGLTGKEGIHRLLPNHELVNFEARRYRNPTLQRQGDDRELAQRIADRLRHNVELICSRGKAEIDLTAGKDSRMVLAAAKNVLDRVTLVTTALPTAAMDCAIASKLARRFGLRHEVRAFLQPTAEDLEQWQKDVGYCVAGGTWRAVTNSKNAPRDVIRVKGLCGEIGRGYWWSDDMPSIPELLRVMGLPADPAVVAAGERWLSGVEGTPEQKLDLAYIEQRLGCWAGPALYGHHFHTVTMSPFNDIQLIEWMQQLSPDYRKAEKLAGDVVRRLWPELLKVPINPRGLKHRAKSVASRAFNWLTTRNGTAKRR